MLKDMYKTFVDNAKGLEGFVVGQKEDVAYDITDLANGYIKAFDSGDKIKANQYFSALMVRYWHLVPLLYEKSKTLRLEEEDIAMWLYDALDKAFKYRSWLDPNKEVSKNPKGAELCINQCITSIRAYWFKHYNQDKRRLNCMTYSLNVPIVDENGQNTATLLDIQYTNDDYNVDKNIISYYLDKKDVYTAIILDGIMFQDTFKETKTTTIKNEINEDGEEEFVSYDKLSYDFSIIRLIKYLSNLDQNFINYFANTYNVNKEEVSKVVDTIIKNGNRKNHKQIATIFNNIKNNKEIAELLCI